MCNIKNQQPSLLALYMAYGDADAPSASVFHARCFCSFPADRRKHETDQNRRSNVSPFRNTGDVY